MPESQIKDKKPPYLSEKVLFEWRAPEYRNLKRLRQYTRIVIVITGLFLVWALYFSNYLFAFFLLIMAVTVLVMGSGHTLKTHQFAITDSGLWIDGELRPFINIRSFAVVPYATKYDRFFVFHQSRGGEFRVPVPLTDAERMRLVVNQYVPQKEYRGGLHDMLDRIFW